MKVLLSAYACEPNKGSEPAVGWHWALEIARLGHEVWVLTRANNRAAIETELFMMEPIPNLHFLYHDLPNWAKWWKKGGRGIRMYYSLWQIGAYRMARCEHRRHGFDRVHHITFVSIRLPSFMGKLGIEFIFGPLGGGDRAPWKLRRGYGGRGWVQDALRDGLLWFARLDPFMRRAFAQADTIYATSQASIDIVPPRWRAKTQTQLAVGVERPARQSPMCRAPQGEQFRFLFVGRLLYLKGMHLGIRAFAEAFAPDYGARLTIVGDGPDGHRWQQLADKIGAGRLIDWKPWVSQSELAGLYKSHDVLLFPSLRDSGGLVVLEALSHGLPVICLDLGGPGIMVDDSCGRVVATAGRTEAQVVEDLSEALEALHKDDSLRLRLSEGACRRAAEFSWERQVRKLYNPAAAGPSPLPGASS